MTSSCKERSVHTELTVGDEKVVLGRKKQLWYRIEAGPSCRRNRYTDGRIFSNPIWALGRYQSLYIKEFKVRVREAGTKL